MPHFVRCIDGHVFDAEVSRQCPTCGATVDVPASSTAAPIVAPAPSEPVIAAQAEAQATPWHSLGSQLSRSAVRIVAGGLALGVAWFAFDQFVLPAINRPSR